MCSIAQYYQALADNDANSHGVSICRLQVAEVFAKDTIRAANAFPSTPPPNSNLNVETGISLTDLAQRNLANIKEKLVEFSKDNDFIYHQPVPAEASLSLIPKLPAAKPIPVSELYQGQDIQKIIGPDIFQRIVPMAVTESASLYDEEKAKLIRAEAERVEIASDEMAASFDYLKLPNSLDVLKGVKEQELSVDQEFTKWCEEVAGHAPFAGAFDELGTNKQSISTILEQSQKNLDMEESVCEKMRSKYGDDWTQQPSSRLTATLRNDIRNYRSAVDEASTSDSRLYSTFRQNENDFEEMRSAGETDEAHVLYQRAMIKAGASRGKSAANSEGNLLDDDFEGGPSVSDQIANIEDLMKRLKMVKKEREQVLKDLKEKVFLLNFELSYLLMMNKVHNDDISNVLILNKKSISNQDNMIFKAELEKFRPHQNRILQANHKQKSLLNELTRAYDTLLQDKRVRSEQSKYEAFNRQRSSVLSKYKKVYQAFDDLVTGLMRAQGFYSEMTETVESLSKNVETFVNNRRSEGGQLLNAIEAAKSSGNSGVVDWERAGVNQLMERMTIDSNSHKSPPPLPSQQGYPSSTPGIPQFHHGMTPAPISSYHPGPPGPTQQREYTYNPQHMGPVSPPPNTATFYQQGASGPQYFSPPPNGGMPGQRAAGLASPPTHRYSTGYSQQQPSTHNGQSQAQQQKFPPGWHPPPPPPGPPPSQQDMNFGVSSDARYPAGPGGYAAPASRPIHQQQQQGGQDPWSGLRDWGR